MSTVSRGGLPRMPVARPLPVAQRLRTPQAPPVVVPPLVIRQKAHGTRVCQWCKEAIKQDALVCPFCRRSQGGLVMGKNLFLCIMAVVAVVLLAIITTVNLKDVADKNDAKKFFIGGDSDIRLDFPPDPTPMEVYMGEPGQ